MKNFEVELGKADRQVEPRVPRGTQVTVRSLAIGGRSIENGSGEEASPAPAIELYSFGILGGVKVKRAG